MLMYLTFSDLNPIHWLIKKKKDVGLNVLSGYFQDISMTIFRSNYFQFELNPLDNKKRYKLLCTFQDIFRTFYVNFQDISVTHYINMYFSEDLKHER